MQQRHPIERPGRSPRAVPRLFPVAPGGADADAAEAARREVVGRPLVGASSRLRAERGGMLGDAASLIRLIEPGLEPDAPVPDGAESADPRRAFGAEMSILRAIVDSTADHIHVKDLDGRYLLVNQADAEGFGLAPDEIVGRTDAELIEAGQAAAVMELDRTVIESGNPLDYEQVETRDGLTRTWQTTKNVVRDPTGRISGLFTISHEITEQRSQEAQLRQTAKMEAVGQLAGGIAHDFNNMLTAIRGYTELVRWDLPPESDQARTDLGQVILAADRAAELTHQLLAFSRRQVLAPRVLDPAEIVHGIAPMLRRLLGEHIDLTIHTAPDVGQILVDPAQLEQVILNLAVNARDAMPNGGQLTIETANADLDTEYVAGHPGGRPGSQVRLAVSDSGTGMDAATRERIFEPFFTTKEAGKGTGLGLATVYGIVKQSEGWMHVHSEPGQGTTFHVFFPRVSATAAVLPELAAAVRIPIGREVILLVEDEPAVRGFARRALASLGYTVLEAANGSDALVVSAAHVGSLDLLVTDVIMPGMQGAALAAEMTLARPGLRTLFVSGFPEDAVIRRGVLADHVAYLPKPFDVAALGRAVRAVLDGPG